MGRIFRKYGLKYHCYADDAQLYFILEAAADWINLRAVIEKCVREVIFWMENNRLKINEGKTEYIVFHPWSSRRQPVCDVISVGNSVIKATDKVKNLGTWWDTHLTMERQINAICQSCYYQIRVLNKSRPYLTESARKTLVQSQVVSRLDYGNSLLVGVPDYHILRLEKVQNSAARFVTGCDLDVDMTPYLKELHWLPVPIRIDYKVVLFVFKCRNSMAPDYLAELVPAYIPPRTLRSEGLNQIDVPKPRVGYGKKTFSYAGAVLWNKLPIHLRDLNSLALFKSSLKTHFFNIVFN